jgi:hypothetical protein
MVIVVPALTHGEQRSQSHVVTLYGCASHFVAHAAVVVREVSDEPVTGDARCDTCTHAPEHEPPSTPGIEEHSPRELLCHPRSLHEEEKAIIRQVRLDRYF